MYTTYRLKASELDKKFIDSVKAQYRNKEIEITVNEIDETEYLLSSQKNRERLLESIDNVKNKRNLREIDLDEIR